MEGQPSGLSDYIRKMREREDGKKGGAQVPAQMV